MEIFQLLIYSTKKILLYSIVHTTYNVRTRHIRMDESESTTRTEWECKK